MPRMNDPRGSTPISRSRATASGISPSPQALSIGGRDFSRTVTSRPARRARMAVASPAGPPPMTTRSRRRRVTGSLPPPAAFHVISGVGQAGARHGPGEAQGGDGLGRRQLTGQPEAERLLAPELAGRGARQGAG